MPSPAHRPAGNWRHYLSLARVDHWIKQVFVLPGIGLAALLTPSHDPWVTRAVIGVLAVCLLASANYVLNEWLDRHHDAQHPLKSSRPAVRFQLRSPGVFALYTALVVLGLGLGVMAINRTFVVLSVLFLVAGALYNTPPLRLKDRALADVVLESFNNPLRLALGWAIVDPSTLPPSSLLLAYWTGGAFLMTIKRLAERRFVVQQAGEEALVAYRPSIAALNERHLLQVAVLYALGSTFALTVFLVKYRIEYLLLIPLVALLFVLYLGLGLDPQSPTQTPEKLWRESHIVLLAAAVVVGFVVLTWIDLPILNRLAEPHYIRILPPVP